MISNFYSKIKDKNVIIAFLSSFIIGLIVHFYKFSNNIINHDSIYNYYSNQDMTVSGRWFLQYACALSSYFDLPWVIGFLSLLFIGLTVVVIVLIFDFKSVGAIIASAAIVVSFPSITHTFFFGFTADGYMLAMFLASLCVYNIRFNSSIIQMCFAGLCLCLCCGIYQAHVSFALVLAVCYFIIQLLDGNKTNKEYIKWIITRMIVLVSALAAYYIIWKICLSYKHIEATDYQGINTIGFLSVNGILLSVKKTIITLITFFLGENFSKIGFTFYSLFNIVFLAVAILLFIFSIIRSKVYKRVIPFILLVLCVCAVPFFICIWFFVSSEVEYHKLMLQSISIIFIFIAELGEKYLKTIVKNGILIVLACVSFSFFISANIAYTSLEKTNNYSKVFADDLVYSIKANATISDFDSVILVGEIAQSNSIEPDKPEYKYSFIIPNYKSLLFDYVHIGLYINNYYWLDYKFEEFSDFQNKSLIDTIEKMTIFPDEESAKVIDGKLYIKLSNDIYPIDNK